MDIRVFWASPGLVELVNMRSRSRDSKDGPFSERDCMANRVLLLLTRHREGFCG